MRWRNIRTQIGDRTIAPDATTPDRIDRITATWGMPHVLANPDPQAATVTITQHRTQPDLPDIGDRLQIDGLLGTAQWLITIFAGTIRSITYEPLTDHDGQPRWRVTLTATDVTDDLARTRFGLPPMALRDASLRLGDILASPEAAAIDGTTIYNVGRAAGVLVRRRDVDSQPILTVLQETAMSTMHRIVSSRDGLELRPIRGGAELIIGTNGTITIDRYYSAPVALPSAAIHQTDRHLDTGAFATQLTVTGYQNDEDNRPVEVTRTPRPPGQQPWVVRWPTRTGVINLKTELWFPAADETFWAERWARLERIVSGNAPWLTGLKTPAHPVPGTIRLELDRLDDMDLTPLLVQQERCGVFITIADCPPDIPDSWIVLGGRIDIHGDPTKPQTVELELGPTVNTDSHEPEFDDSDIGSPDTRLDQWGDITYQQLAGTGWLREE